MEFLYKLVFCKTIESLKGPRKLDKLLIVKSFNNNLDALGKAVGLPDMLLLQY